MSSPLRSLSLAACASLLLHGAAMWAARRVEASRPPRPEPEPDLFAFDIVAPEVQEDPSRESTEPAVPPPPQPAVRPDVSVRARRPRRERAASTEPVAPAPPPTEATPPPTVAEPTPPREEPPPAVEQLDPERRRRQLEALLNPRAVASGVLDFGPGPTQRSGPAGLGTVDRGVGEAEAEARLAGALGRQANARPQVDKPSRPRLRRQADGSYVWQGPRTRARIRPDGTVEWEDSPNVQTNGVSTSGTFDIGDAVMSAAGQDPLAAEREWFLRNTRAVRHRLEAEARAKAMASGLRRLRGRLSRIWASEAEDAPAKRRRIFRIWDECDEGEAGAGARRIVLAFVREVLPTGSPQAFSASELSALNQVRRSREAFAPYR